MIPESYVDGQSSVVLFILHLIFVWMYKNRNCAIYIFFVLILVARTINFIQIFSRLYFFFSRLVENTNEHVGFYRGVHDFLIHLPQKYKFTEGNPSIIPRFGTIFIIYMVERRWIITLEKEKENKTL